MSNLLKFIRYWLPAFAWMIFIFVLSSRTKVSLGNVETINFIIFKTLHVMEYAFLYFLLFRGFYSLKNLSIGEKYLWPFIIAMFYAATDEFHQTFIATRGGHPRDVIIDTIGIFFMYIYIRKYLRFIKKLI